MRFIASIELEKNRSSLIAALAEDLVNSEEPPSYDLRWLTETSPGLRQAIIQYVTQPEHHDPNRLYRELHVESKELADITALRGYVGCGLLVHGLARRHRVDHGVKRPGKKHLAVPFRAADTPATRAEFGHPDTIRHFYTPHCLTVTMDSRHLK